MKQLLFLFLLCGLSSCTSDPLPQAQGEFLYRKEGEQVLSYESPQWQQRPPHSWEAPPQITKEYFRCKGHPSNPIKTIEKEGEITYLRDCNGSRTHSLPVREGKEFVYSILLELLNYIQLHTGKQVVITSAHRCPTHNTYVDPSKENETSKHMVGAEVSFYVEGMEEVPEEIIALIIQYYQVSPQYANSSAYQTFKRYTKPATHVSIEPWYNKEIFLKLFQPDEGRNEDNRHPYPYLSIQVRYDRETKEHAIYSWPKAHRNYFRE